VMFAVESFPLPWAMYMPPLSAPPEGSDLVEEWQVFHGIARRLALPLSINGVDLGLIESPASDEVLAAILRGAAVELNELKRHPRGAIFDVSTTVAPTDPDLPDDRRLHVGEARVLADLAELAASDHGNDAPFRLVVRRTKEMKNSWGNDFALMTQRFPRQNPAWLHPQDMADLGLATDDPVEIRSAHGTIRCLAEADETVLLGTVSVSHGWGGDGHPGANTNALTNDLDAGDRHSAVPVMSSIPVWIDPAPVRR
jgi:anaerobic selenocysteine-containing dehydrogenase